MKEEITLKTSCWYDIAAPLIRSARQEWTQTLKYRLILSILYSRRVECSLSERSYQFWRVVKVSQAFTALFLFLRSIKPLIHGFVKDFHTPTRIEYFFSRVGRIKHLGKNSHRIFWKFNFFKALRKNQGSRFWGYFSPNFWGYRIFYKPFYFNRLSVLLWQIFPKCLIRPLCFHWA